jgi:hypothetical protein
MMPENNAWAVQFYCDEQWLTEKWFKHKAKAVHYSDESSRLHGIPYRVEATYFDIFNKEGED